MNDSQLTCNMSMQDLLLLWTAVIVIVRLNDTAVQWPKLTDTDEVKEKWLVTTVPNRITQGTVLLNVFVYFSSTKSSDHQIIQKAFCVHVWFRRYVIGIEFYIREQL